MAALLFALVALIYSVSPVITNYDSYSFFPTAVSLVNHGTLSLDEYRHVPSVAGSYTVMRSSDHLVTSYPWAVSLFAVPAVVAIDVLHAAGGPSAESVVSNHPQIGSLAQLWSASLVTALACALLTLLVYRRLGGTERSRRRWAFGAGVVFALCTSAWSTASRALWQHGPAILFLSAGLLGLDRIFPRLDRTDTASPPPRAAAFGCGLAFAAAVAMRPTNVVALALAGLPLAWKARAMFVPYLTGALCTFAPWMVITYHYYGSFIQPYDKADKLGFTSTFFESIGANLFSPSRGLLIFSPVVLASVAGAVIVLKSPQVALLEYLSAAFVVLYLIVIAMFPVWWAGNSFGPRFTSEMLPFLLLLAIPFIDWLRTSRESGLSGAHLHYRWAVGVTVVLVLCSVVVNAQGGLVRASTCWNGKPHTSKSVDNDPSRVWSWSDPQFDYGLRALGSIGARAVMHCPASV